MKVKTKFLGILLIIAAMGVFTTCKDDEPAPPVDNRPRVEGIIVTGAYNDHIIAELTKAFSHTSLSDTQKAYLKSHITKIEEVSGSVAPSFTGDILTVGNSDTILVGSIVSAFGDWLDGKGITMMYDQVKNIIYIAAAKNVKPRPVTDTLTSLVYHCA